MGRPARIDVGGYVYHALNRSVGRRMIFSRDGDFVAFERVLAEALDRAGGDVSLLAYCIMGNHWHLVLRTRRDGALAAFMQWLTLTHTQRYRAARENVGEGPLYRGRFKSCLVEQDGHLLTLCRYVERNAARAELVVRAEDWRWSSLWRSRQAQPSRVEESPLPLVLSDWPIPGGRPKQWLRTVNTPLTLAELEALRSSIRRARPYGSPAWQARQVSRFGLESTLRPPGRPRKTD